MITCTNCSETGHTSKHCTHPITSYGVIAFRIRGATWNQPEDMLNPEVRGFETTLPKIEFLLIQRKDSIGFVEIMRGKYKLTDIPYIKYQLRGMTREERNRLLTRSFDELWEDLWGPPQLGSQAYKNEKETARAKLEALRTNTPSLAELLEEVGPGWDTPEWGFPKGRRDLHETEYACAMRELWEETNLSDKDISIIRNLEPISETFVGSNSIHYCHKYFIGYVPPNAADQISLVSESVNMYMRREVGGIGWFPFETAIEKIRPENMEKREILLRVHNLLRLYCPVVLNAGKRSKPTT